MNKPNPFETQTSTAEQLKKSRARLRFAVFGAITVGAIILVPLLVQGCKREEAPPAPVEDTNTTSALDTNGLPPVEPVHSNVLSLPPINLPPLTSSVPVGTLAPVSAIAPIANGSEYTVAKGDSFYTIGKKFGVSTKAISDANPGVDSKKLKVGQKLNLPAAAASVPTAPGNNVAPTESAATEATYTVKSGDTLLRIAKAHGTTVKVIKSANSLTTDKI